MINIILYGILIIWIIAGGIAALMFYAEEVLPATNRYKNIIGIIVCGPLVWIIRPLFVSIIKLGDWLCEG